MGNVFIDQNLKKVSERIDPQGNVINPRTKQIIQPVIEEYIEPTVPQNTPPNAPQAPTANAMSIQEQIDETKKKLLELEELKKLKIAQMKAELELLEK
ncbi:MAG: hypothetical protein KA802_10545 [Saprospiraceae bacterium]|nr:hypothetical protein [Saprospiraceae bacterium]